MNEQTFTQDGVTITVRMSIGWDASDKRVIYSKLGQVGLLVELDTVNNRAVTFARMIIQTVKTEGLAFELPNANAPARSLAYAYSEINRLSDSLLTQWINALDAADMPPVAQPDFNPSTDPNAEANPVLQENAAD